MPSLPPSPTPIEISSEHEVDPRQSVDIQLLESLTLAGPATPETGTFSALPSEVKLLVFEELLQSGEKTEFLNALQVCKDWNSLGTPMIWSDVNVNNNNILPFIKSLITARSTTCDSVGNLAIQVRPTRDQVLEEQNPHRRLYNSRLRTILGLRPNHLLLTPRSSHWLLPAFLLSPNDRIGKDYPENNTKLWNVLVIALERLLKLVKDKLRHIQTSSFRVMEQSTMDDPSGRTRPGPGMDLSRDILVQYLESLPLSCINVELDDAGISREFPLTQSSKHLCACLYAILPRLHHLHIGIYNLCPSFLGYGYDGTPWAHSSDYSLFAPHLRTLSVNIRPSRNYSLPSSRTCCKDIFTQEGKWMIRNTLPITEETCLVVAGKREKYFQEVHNTIVKALCCAVNAGAFPSIKNLILVNCLYTEKKIGTTRRAYSIRVDVLQQTLDLLPLHGIDLTYYIEVNLPDMYVGETAIVMQDGRILFTGAKDRHDHIKDLRANTWFTTKDGARYPLQAFGSPIVNFEKALATRVDTCNFTTTTSLPQKIADTISHPLQMHVAHMEINESLQSVQASRPEKFEGLSLPYDNWYTLS